MKLSTILHWLRRKGHQRPERDKINHKVQFNKIYPNTDPENLFAFLDYARDKHHG